MSQKVSKQKDENVSAEVALIFLQCGRRFKLHGLLSTRQSSFLLSSLDPQKWIVGIKFPLGVVTFPLWLEKV